jgi:hypothetical protein
VLEAAGFRALEELFAVAAVDMEGPTARGRAPWVGRDLWLWEEERLAGEERAASSKVRAAQVTQCGGEWWRR